MPISKINTTSITDNSVTAGKIVAGAVDADIAAGSIDTAQIADDAVTADKLANAINTSIAAKLPLAGGTMTGVVAGFTSTGIDDNATSNAITIDSSENVGIGTSSPSGLAKTLNIDGGSSGSSFALDGGPNFAVIYSGATVSDPTSLFSNTGFKFGTATSKAAAGFSERMRIKADGHVSITDGNLQIASGKGIDFSAKADSSATGASTTSELLDHYEEGTWTPVFPAGGTSWTAHSAKYTRIGDMVHIQCYIDGMASGGTGVSARMSGLPYACTGNAWATGSLNLATANADKTNFHTRVLSNSAAIDFKHGRDTTMIGTDVDASHIIFSVTYYV